MYICIYSNLLKKKFFRSLTIPLPRSVVLTPPFIHQHLTDITRQRTLPTTRHPQIKEFLFVYVYILYFL